MNDQPHDPPYYKVYQPYLVQSYGTAPIFCLVQVSADQSSYWIKAAASAECGVFSNVKHITAWFGHCLLYSLLYKTPWEKYF